MEKRKKREHDFSITAFRVVQEATGQITPKPAKKKGFDFVALGRAGGFKGGKARAENLTPERRVEIAKKAALARWRSPYNEIKATQVAALLVKLNGGEMDYATCIKILYNIEREALNRWLSPVIYDDLYSLPMGQVVSRTMDRAKPRARPAKTYWSDYLKTNSNNIIQPIQDCGIDKLSRAEIELIKEIYLENKDKTPAQLFEEHHDPNLFPEWINPHSSRIQTKYSDLLRKLGKTEEQIAEFEDGLDTFISIESLSK